MLPVDRLRDFIRRNELFLPTDRLLVAVSGGRDSVLLAHFFKQAQFQFGVAHCNFMLRGEESEADEQFTRALAAELGVPFYAVRFDTEEYASQNSISIQMAARSLRFEWLETIRKEHGYQYIATAHHQSDVLETVLLNLVRGTGISGLHGILPKREHLIRPLLFLTRSEVDQLVDANSMPYRDDLSNFSSKYARNKIRLEVVPKLKELNPNLEATFEANIRRFSELEVVLREKVDATTAQLVKEEKESAYISLHQLRELRPLSTLLYEILKPYSFSETVVQDLIRSLNGQPGLRFESVSHSLVLDRDRLIITKKATPVSAVDILEAEAEATWNGQRITIQEMASSNSEIGKERHQAVVDADRLTFPLQIRSWRKGDFFHPLGLKGKKKLSDFFINKKVPLTEKTRIPILVNGTGEIIWVAGMRLDDRFKVTPNTKKVYIFELK